MADEKKAFFRERTEPQIEKLEVKAIYSPEKVVEQLLAIEDSSRQAVGLRARMIPRDFFGRGRTEAQAARMWMKHGLYFRLTQPQTQAEALQLKLLPHQMRRTDFAKFGNLPDGDFEALLGYSFRPVQGPDRKVRLVPFSSITGGTRIFCYDAWLKETNPFHQNLKTIGLVVKPYADSEKVAYEGAEITVDAPSRTKGKGKYTMKLLSVPIVDNAWKFPISLSFGSTYKFGVEPEQGRFLIRYKWAADPSSSRAEFILPHVIAAYQAVVRHYSTKEGKKPEQLAKDKAIARVLWDMNPFAKPSQLAATLDTRIGNNLLVFDGEKKQYRKPYVAERAHLLATAIRELGHDATMFWDSRRPRNPDPEIIADYKWGTFGGK